jgi:hypothetical protein
MVHIPPQEENSIKANSLPVFAIFRRQVMMVLDGNTTDDR